MLVRKTINRNGGEAMDFVGTLVMGVLVKRDSLMFGHVTEGGDC